MNNTVRDEFKNKVTKLGISKTLAKDFEDSVYNYCEEYATTNDTLFLLEEIYNTKVDELLSHLTKKKSELLDSILNSKISVKDIVKMSPDELSPEQFSQMKGKKSESDKKKNSKTGTTLYTCPKCNRKNSEITEQQMRRGDEPPTLFVKCLECGHKRRI